MANFTVRVELLGIPDAETYNRLKEAMAKSSFYDYFFETINGVKIKYELPPAEYALYNSNQTTTQVRDAVVQIVKSIWKEFRVWVVLTTIRWEYHNLKKLS